MQATVLADGVLPGVDHFLAWHLVGAGGFFRQCLARHGQATAIGIAAVHQPLRQQANAARLVHIRGEETPGGHQIADERRALADRLDVIDGEGDACLAGNRQAVQHHVGRATAGRRRGNGVLQRSAGDDLARRQVLLDHLHDEFARPKRDIVLVRCPSPGCRPGPSGRCRSVRQTTPSCWR